jgi:glycosyltransferase involved in cell wall biosynthesis
VGVRQAVEGRIIVVDDASTDGTSEAAVTAGADLVIRHETNQGKGAALNTALSAGTGRLLLLLDADLGETAALVRPLVDAVAAGQCDMCVAAWASSERKSGFGFAQALARWGIHRRTGRAFASPISGQRCVSRQWVNRLGGFAGGFCVEVALTLAVLRAGGTVDEVPLPLRHRKTGRTLDGFLHRGKQAVAILRALRAPSGPAQPRSPSSSE